ncbi:MAG: hypothetical protein AAFX87_03385 [Bacteroidota bacterium]
MTSKIKIALIGDNVSVDNLEEQVLQQTARKLKLDCQYDRLDSDAFQRLSPDDMSSFDAFWVGSGPFKNDNGVFEAIKFARINNFPLLATCLGSKYIVWEFAKNVLDEDPREYRKYVTVSDEETDHVDLIIKPNTSAFDCYTHDEVSEAVRLQFKMNEEKLNELFSYNFVYSGEDEEGTTKIIEFIENDFYLATLFSPQLTQRRNMTYPLAKGLLQAAVEHKSYFVH